MSKRYREFLIELIVKSYQIIFAVMVITPVATNKLNLPLFALGVLMVSALILWGGTISSRMGEQINE